MSAQRSNSAPDSDGKKARRKSGVRASAPDEDRRRHNRYDVWLPVRFATEGSADVSAHCANVSLGGMMIRVTPGVTVGKSMRLWLTLPSGVLFMTGVVVWTAGDRCGVRQELLSAHDTHVLTEHLAELSAELPAVR